MGNKKLRVLVIDGEEKSSDQISESLKAIPAVKVLRAENHKKAEELMGLKRSRNTKIHLVLANASSDLRETFSDDGLGPVHLALQSQLKKKIPTVVYSPFYSGEKLSKLEEMVEGTFSEVAEMEGIEEVARKHLQKELWVVFRRILRAIRSVRAEAHELIPRLRDIVDSMSEETRSKFLEFLSPRERTEWQFE